MMDRAIMEALEVEPGQLRENITVEGISLFGLEKGQKLRIGGGLEFQIGELCDPCDNMDHIRPGLREKIQGQRGLFVTPLGSGTVSVGAGNISATAIPCVTPKLSVSGLAQAWACWLASGSCASRLNSSAAPNMPSAGHLKSPRSNLSGSGIRP